VQRSPRREVGANLQYRTHIGRSILGFGWNSKSVKLERRFLPIWFFNGCLNLAFRAKLCIRSNADSEIRDRRVPSNPPSYRYPLLFKLASPVIFSRSRWPIGCSRRRGGRRDGDAQSMVVTAAQKFKLDYTFSSAFRIPSQGSNSREGYRESFWCYSGC
jgi:hypothetical protein